MTVPTNAPIEWRGTAVTLESSGGSITNNSVVQADDASYAADVEGEWLADAEFVLTFAFGTAPTDGTALALYARPLNIASTNDAEVPELTRPTRFIGSFIVNNVTTTQYATLVGRNVPLLADYYLANVGTGQTVSSGWVLTAYPRAQLPAP